VSNSIDRNTIITLITILASTTVYAVTRYVLSGAVNPENIPVYIINKAVAFSAVIALLLSAIAYLKDNNLGARDWGKISFHLAVVHILLSSPLWGIGYFEQFYFEWGTVDGKHVNMREHVNTMKLTGELTMLFGVLGVYTYFMLFLSKHGTKAMAYLKLATTFCIAIHIGIVPYLNWAPWAWSKKFNMPPISLLSFLCVGLAFLIYLKMKDAKQA